MKRQRQGGVFGIRPALRLLAPLLGLLVAAACTSVAAARQRPLIIFISTDHSPAVMGAACGIEQVARQWAQTAKAPPELWLMAGVATPETLTDGIDEALFMDADTMILWPGEADLEALPDLLDALEFAGVSVVLLGERMESPPANVLAQYALSAADLPQGPALLDAPAFLPRLESGAVSCIYCSPAEDWGRAAVLTVMKKVDPDAAALMGEPQAPRGILRFTPDDAPACRDLWHRWLNQRVGHIDLR